MLRDHLREQQQQAQPRTAVGTCRICGKRLKSETATVHAACKKKDRSASKQRRTAAAVTARMTDASQYTATHRHRFGEDGSGLGRQGRLDLDDFLHDERDLLGRMDESTVRSLSTVPHCHRLC